MVWPVWNVVSTLAGNSKSWQAAKKSLLRGRWSPPACIRGVEVVISPTQGGVAIRGRVDRQASTFAAFNLEDAIREAHPLRKVKRWADAMLVDMRADLRAACSEVGRPGIPPEQMLKALLLCSLYAIPSERLRDRLPRRLLCLGAGALRIREALLLHATPPTSAGCRIFRDNLKPAWLRIQREDHTMHSLSYGVDR